MKFITPIVVLAICVSAYFVYVRPAYSEVQVLSAQKAAYMETLAQSKSLKETRDTILNTYNAISATEINKLNKILPDRSDEVLLAFNLNTIAAKYGLTMDEFEATKGDDAKNTGNRDAVVVVVPDEPYKTTTVSLTLSGKYRQFLSFLKDIESNLQLMDVTSIVIKQGGKEELGSDPILEYSIEIKTYSLK